jgi:hypothetical protein
MLASTNKGLYFFGERQQGHVFLSSTFGGRATPSPQTVNVASHHFHGISSVRTCDSNRVDSYQSGQNCSQGPCLSLLIGS